jgi:hypothetical protein
METSETSGDVYSSKMIESLLGRAGKQTAAGSLSK